MMKQSKNKKGRLAKSTLSVVLAASMVLTSSSFVWASPVIEEVEPTAIVEEISAASAEEIVKVATGNISLEPVEWGEDLEVNVTGLDAKATDLTYSWFYADGTQIGVENGKTYTTVKGDAGKAIYAKVDYKINGQVQPTAETESVTILKQTIEDADLKLYKGAADVTKKPSGLTYNGQDQSNQITAKIDKNGEEITTGFSTNPTSSTEAGRMYISVEMTTNEYYRGSAQAYTEIAGADLNGATFVTSSPVAFPDETYAGSPIEKTIDTITVKMNLDGSGDKNIVLKNNVDYTLTWKNNDKAGTATAKVVGKGNYQGDLTNSIGFTILAQTGEFNATWKTGMPAAVTYSGKAKAAADFKNDFVVRDGSKTLVYNTDYTLKYEEGSDGKSAGTQTIEIIGQGNYSTKTKTSISYEIAPVVITDVKKITIGNLESAGTYSGTAKEPKLANRQSVKVELSDKTVLTVPSTDYDITYKNNIDAYNIEEDKPGYNADIAPTAVFSFKNNFAGTVSKDKAFTITPAKISSATITVDKSQTLTYNGASQLPKITVTQKGLAGVAAHELAEGTDYEISLAGNNLTDGKAVNAGTYTISVNGLGNYVGSSSAGTFDIKAKTLTADSVSVACDDMGYTGSGILPTFKVTESATGEDVSADFEIVKIVDSNNITKYNGLGSSNCINKGKYTVTLNKKTSNANYTGDVDFKTTFNIVAPTIASAVVTTDWNADMKKPYTGKSQIPEITEVKFDGVNNPLVKDTDYVIEYPDAKDCVNAGTYKIVIKGLNAYDTTSKEVTFVIEPKEIESSWIIAQSVQTNTGDGNKVSVTIKDGTTTLENGKDYTFTSDNTYVTVTGIGNYATKTPVKKRISTAVVGKMSLNDASISAKIKDSFSATYTGRAIQPTAADIEIVENGTTPYTLVAGTDYELSATGTYKDNLKAGTATVVVQGKGNRYSAEPREVTFTIAPADMTVAYRVTTGTLETSVNYDSSTKKDYASDIKSVISVNAISSTTTPSLLSKDTDYAVSYKKDGAVVTKVQDPGEYTVVVAGKGNYTGESTFTFTIHGVQIGSIATVDAIADQDYTGEEVKPAVTVKAKTAGVTLKEDTDYTVSYKNNTAVGEAFAIVTGKGIYEGTILTSFNIKGIDISEATVAVDGKYTYTGKAITPKVTVKVGDTVINPANYDVVATDNTNAGTAKFTVVGKNNCTGTTKEATFEIGKADQKLAVSKTIADALKVRNTNANTYTLKVTGASTALTYKSSNTKIASVNAAGKISFKHVCGKATITVTAAADGNHNAATLKVAVAVKPATPKITVSGRSKGFNVKATAIKDITGYQVGYSTDKNFAASKTIKKTVTTTKALSKNFSGLSAKKGYYVRVRAYKKVGTTVYWGNWTSAKKITTK